MTTNDSFEDNNVNILARKDRWFEREIKESIYVQYGTAVFEQRRWRLTLFITHASHLGSPSLQQPTRRPVGSTSSHVSLDTQSLKVCDSPAVNKKWRSLLDERWNVFKKLKQVQHEAIHPAQAAKIIQQRPFEFCFACFLTVIFRLY